MLLKYLVLFYYLFALTITIQDLASEHLVRLILEGRKNTARPAAKYTLGRP